MSRTLTPPAAAKPAAASPAAEKPWQPFIHPLARAIDEGALREDTPEEAREADAAFAELQFRLANRGLYCVTVLALAVVFGGDLVEGLLR